MGEHNAAFNEPQLERPNWFARRLLTAEDLDLEQTYFRERMRRRNRLLHGWGVVTGLEVTPADGVGLTLEPGFALDAAGNEIVVPEADHVDARAIGLTTAGAMHWLAIRWDECPSGEIPVPEPGESSKAGAWREAFEVVILDTQPSDGPASSPSATPWLALATVVWDGAETLTVDASVRRPLQLPVEP